MAIDPQYMIEFLEECVQVNKSTPDEMCDLARDKIKKIDNRIKEIEKLRSEKSNLSGIIKQFSKNIPKNNFKYDWSTPKDKLTQNELILFANICEYIDITPGATPSNIISAVASLEIQDEVYNAIKWLTYNQIIRKENKKHFYPGDKWEERPLIKSDEENQQTEAREAS